MNSKTMRFFLFIWFTFLGTQTLATGGDWLADVHDLYRQILGYDPANSNTNSQTPAGVGCLVDVDSSKTNEPAGSKIRAAKFVLKKVQELKTLS